MSKPVLLFDSILQKLTTTGSGVEGILSASSTATGYHVRNVADMRTYTFWKPSSSTSNIDALCSTQQPADYCLLLVDTACSVQIRGSGDGFVSENVQITTAVLSGPGLHLIPFAAQNYKGYRIAFSGGTPAVSLALVGEKFELPDYLPEGFAPIDRKAIGAKTRNESGQPLGAAWWFREYRATLSFQNTDWTWLRDNWLPAWESHLELLPFGFAWSPTAYPTEIVWCMSDGMFNAPHQSVLASLSFAIEGAL